MSKVILRKYGEATTFPFTLYETDGVNFKTDAVYVSGDVKLMKDEGAETNVASGFTDEGQGNTQPLSATEMEFARGKLYIADQGIKVWLDTDIYVETYGHASAQHPNFGEAMRGTDNAALATDLAIVDGKVDAIQTDLDNPDQYKADVSTLALEASVQDILDQVTGTGNRVVTINVKDDGANNLQDVLVRIGAASVYTDVSGNAKFALDDGDYDVILRKQYVSFTVPEPLTVAGDGTHPYVGALITPSLPVQPDTCVVFGVVIDDGGFPVESASVFINETDNNTFANTQKIVKNRQTTSDSDGFWELEIVRSSQLTPADSPYDVIIMYPNGFKYETTITVPDQDTVEFSTIAGT